MIRIKRGTTTKKRHKKILKLAKGYYGARSKCYKTAKQAVIKAGQYSYRDRKIKKRYFRKLWIKQINSAVRNYGLTYNYFINKLNKLSIKINRKMLSNLITKKINLFENLISIVKNTK